MEQKLSERKQKILKAVVDEYIKNAAPVSSGEIKTKYFDDISSATIRSELSTLEDMGFLVQPHTSAGRSPSPRAYKYYVKHFLHRHPLKKQDVAKIDTLFSSQFAEVEEIVRTAAKIISDVTNYTSVIVLKNINNVTIKDIKLVGLDGRSILVVIITDSGIIRDKIINVDYKDEKFLQDANNLINKVFSGKTVAALKTIPSVLERELNDFRELINSVLALLLSYCEGCDEDVILEGENKILTYPEASVESARNFLSIIDDRKHIAGLIGGDTNDIEFSVKIGKDETGGMDKCAIVTAKYMINGKEIGHAGVIGPERMDYSKVMSVLSYVGEALDTIIKPQGGKDEKK